APTPTQTHTLSLHDALPISHALARGSELGAAERADIAEKLHQYTGLPVDYILRADLRIDGGEFRQNLQGDDGRTTGRLDSRFSRSEEHTSELQSLRHLVCRL